MTIYYPSELPLGLQTSADYQTVSPLQRTELTSGRARQRRRFTSVPTMRSISWVFTSKQTTVFEAWFRDVLVDGEQWFEMPLKTPQGIETVTCRFTDIYDGPKNIGPELWSLSAQLELRYRPIAPPGFGEFPEYIIDANVLDIALNDLWPPNPWQKYIIVADTAINQDWPTP